MRPPPALLPDELPLTVLLFRVMVLPLQLTMPPPTTAELPLMVVVFSVTVPPSLTRPPPKWERPPDPGALPFRIVMPSIVTVTPLVMKNTRLVAVPGLVAACTMVLPAPAPVRVRFLFTVIPASV